VLAHVHERAAAVARLPAQVRAGGVVAFLEPVILSPTPTTQPRPLLGDCLGWLVETLRRAGARADTALLLPEIFAEAGLPEPRYRIDGVPNVGADRGYLAIVATMVCSALPAMERFGVATAEQLGPDTLVDRLVAEAQMAGGTALAFCVAGAWVRLG
jgi:hypothetical protein